MENVLMTATFSAEDDNKEIEELFFNSPKPRGE
jgi:hypothetical protein